MMTGELLTLKKEVSAFFHECTFYIYIPLPSHMDRHKNHSTSTNLVYFTCVLYWLPELTFKSGIGVRQYKIGYDVW